MAVRAESCWQLRGADQDGCGWHEPDEQRLRQQVSDDPGAEKSDEQPYETDESASSSPSSMYLVLPTDASGESAPNVKRALTAVGPGWRYGDEANGAATSGGIAAAKRPR